MAEVSNAALVRLERTIATVSKGLRNALIANQNWLILLLFIADVSFRLPLALSLALQGDSATHALVGEQIVATGRLPNQIPYFVTDPGKGWPVAYPQFFFVLLAGGYAVAGEAGLKAISPLLGSLTVVFLFVFARRLYGVKVAALSAIVLMGERHLFVVTIETLMESAVALFTLVAFFEFHYYIEKRRNRDLLGAIAGLALLLSTKQQAYVAILSLVLTTPLLAAFFRLHRERKPAGWSFPFRAALATIIGALLIASPWLVLQIQTAGTVDYPPGLSITQSFMTPKWTVDPDSMQVLNSIRAVVFYVAPEQAAGFLVYLQFYTAPIPFLFVIAITTVVGYLVIALDRTKRIFAIVLSANIRIPPLVLGSSLALSCRSRGLFSLTGRPRGLSHHRVGGQVCPPEPNPARKGSGIVPGHFFEPCPVPRRRPDRGEPGGESKPSAHRQPIDDRWNFLGKDGVREGSGGLD